LRPERVGRRLLEEVRQQERALHAEVAQRLQVHLPEALRVEVSVEEPWGCKHGFGDGL